MLKPLLIVHLGAFLVLISGLFLMYFIAWIVADLNLNRESSIVSLLKYAVF